jgi:hypothetical protein
VYPGLQALLESKPSVEKGISAPPDAGDGWAWLNTHDGNSAISKRVVKDRGNSERETQLAFPRLSGRRSGQ